MKARLGLIVSAALFSPVGCAASHDGAADAESIDIVRQEAHSIATHACARGMLPRAGNPLSYGNWCGADVSGPDAPISCWDAACQAHDYAFGRWQDGYASCHSITHEQNMDDTPCTLAADNVLCEKWSDCNSQHDAARSTWYASPGAGELKCRPNPPRGRPASRGRREPIWCPWLETYTCEDAFPCPTGVASSPTITPNCGVPIAPATEAAAAAMASSSQGALYCCQHYPQAQRDTIAQCSSGDVVLAGGNDPTIGISVDDDLTIYVNGIEVFADSDGYDNSEFGTRGVLAPISFSAQNGDWLQIVATDSVGGCRDLSPELTLHRTSDGASQVVGGFPRACGFGSGEVFVDKNVLIAFP
jgi:hypothetical protein